MLYKGSVRIASHNVPAKGVSAITMWLPEPLYESLPYLYVISGALILGGNIYIGIGDAGMPFFFLIGVLSILGGVVIYLRRRTARQKKSGSDLSET